MNKYRHNLKCVKKNKTVHIGRYTITHLVDDKNNEAIGIARLSDDDKDVSDVGESIAKGRAERALICKRGHKKIRHFFMG